MARISSEKAVGKIGNRYDLILVASARVRELNLGYQSKLKNKKNYGKSLTALKEVEEGLVGRDYIKRVR